MRTVTIVWRIELTRVRHPIRAGRSPSTADRTSHVTYADVATTAEDSNVVNELSSAETAWTALRPVLHYIGGETLHLPTPCPGFDVAALADHLAGTVTMVGDSAGADSATGDDLTIAASIGRAVEPTIGAWRRRGVEGNAVFSGRVMPARLALGVLSIELVVHGWDFSQALGRPMAIAAAHAGFVLGLAREIITPDSRRTAGFDEPVPVMTDAAAMDRLVAYTGRQPRRALDS